MTVCESTGDLIMILTLAEEGNLNRQIELTAQTNMAQVADIVTRLALNLASLHDDIRMCHRNIHPENILSVDEDYFLVDYRFSTSIQESSKVTQSSMVHYGRVPYIAPEVREKGIYSEKSDVYSLGVIMWQLISGVIFPPSPDVLLGASHIYRIEWVPGVSRWYQELAMACLEPNPEHRPSAEEIGLIARKIAVSCQHQEPDQSWISYVVNRQAKTKSHIDKWLDHQDLKGTATASRVYTLDELPNTDALLNHVPFHCRPFDPDNISYQIESEKNEQI
jgi:serine/threonine protein kinase